MPAGLKQRRTAPAVGQGAGRRRGQSSRPMAGKPVAVTGGRAAGGPGLAAMSRGAAAALEATPCAGPVPDAMTTAGTAGRGASSVEAGRCCTVVGSTLRSAAGATRCPFANRYQMKAPAKAPNGTTATAYLVESRGGLSAARASAVFMFVLPSRSHRRQWSALHVNFKIHHLHHTCQRLFLDSRLRRMVAEARRHHEQRRRDGI
jgi:hypothetical protein